VSFLNAKLSSEGAARIPGLQNHLANIRLCRGAARQVLDNLEIVGDNFDIPGMTQGQRIA
jgi:hypothetical protein